MTAAVLNFSLAFASGAVPFDRAPSKLVFLVPDGRQWLACAWHRDALGRLFCDWHQPKRLPDEIHPAAGASQSTLQCHSQCSTGSRPPAPFGPSTWAASRKRHRDLADGVALTAPSVALRGRSALVPANDKPSLLRPVDRKSPQQARLLELAENVENGSP
jgi:hypothetical protein